MTATTAVSPPKTRHRFPHQVDSDFILRRIEQQAKIVDDAEAAVEEARQVYRNRKKRCEEEHAKLLKMAHEQDMKLFEKMSGNGAGGAAIPTIPHAGDVNTGDFVPPAEELAPREKASVSSSSTDEAWRSIELGSLEDWPAGTLGHLAMKDLITLGALADWTNLQMKSLTDIRGISQTKADAIEKRLEKFWEDWKEPGIDGDEDDDEKEGNYIVGSP